MPGALYGWTPTVETVVVGVIVLAWLWTLHVHYAVEEQRRDLLTDMTQLIHDGKVDADDLRRARDLPAIEERLERDADAED